MRKLSFYILLILPFGTSVTTDAQVLAAGTVGTAVSDLRDVANETIHSLDSVIGNNLFRARQEIELLIGRLEASTKGVFPK